MTAGSLCSVSGGQGVGQEGPRGQGVHGCRTFIKRELDQLLPLPYNSHWLVPIALLEFLSVFSHTNDL